jgi:hypothetical protein
MPDGIERLAYVYLQGLVILCGVTHPLLKREIGCGEG